MAGEQDIIALGLNIDSFDASKMTRLKEFIGLFNDLSKYDGKVFNPVLGNGLADFNASVQNTTKLLGEMDAKLVTITSHLADNKGAVMADSKEIQLLTSRLTQQEKELTAIKLKLSEYSRGLIENSNATKASIRDKENESRATKALASDYQILKQVLKEQAETYQNLFINKGKGAPETKAALAEYAATAGVIDSIDKNLDKAAGRTQLFGGALSTAFSHLRNIAYILPGLGIAGIFNLAFEAVGALVDEMVDLGAGTIKQIEFTNKLNDAYLQLKRTFEEVYVANKRIAELHEGSYASNVLKTLKNLSRGFSPDKIFVSEISNLEQRVSDADKLVEKSFGKGRIKDMIKAQQEASEEIKNKGVEILSLKPGGIERKLIGGGKADALIEQKQGEIEDMKFDYKNRQDIIEEYYASRNELSKKKAEFDKFNEDQERKRVYETAKSNIAVKMDENEQILHSDIQSEIDKIQALESISNSQKQANLADYKNIFDNNTPTPKEREIAETKLNDANNRADIKYNEDYLKLTEDYRQKRLKAITQINKDEVEKEAVRNERIYKDETKSLDERLEAYKIYVVKRQTLQDLEYSKDVDVLSLKANDPTARKQIEALQSARDLQKVNIQADSEKQVYDIVYQSLIRELTTVKDFNKLEEDANNEAYTKSLKSLNKNFEDKKISFDKYYEARKNIDLKYRLQYLDAVISDDKAEVLRTTQFVEKQKKLLSQANKDVDTDNVLLLDAKSSGRSTLGPQRNLNESVGKQKAINDALIKAQKELIENKKQLDKDELKRQQEAINQKFQKDDEESRRRSGIISAVEQGEKAVYEAVTTIADRAYQRRIDKVNELSQSIEEQYSKEISAIEQSSLTEKEKAALQIQLLAEKEAREKNAAAESKKIRREQAEFDKKASIAQILVSTALAEIKAFTEGDPYTKVARAILAGVAGAAALAIAVSADIPNYEDGTQGVPHKGGLARTGEKGKPELIKEPYKSPYLVTKENISYLPAGTEVIPLIKSHPVFGNITYDNSSDQTDRIINAIKSSNKEIKNVFKPNIYVDTRFMNYRNSILN